MRWTRRPTKKGPTPGWVAQKGCARRGLLEACAARNTPLPRMGGLPCSTVRTRRCGVGSMPRTTTAVVKLFQSNFLPTGDSLCFGNAAARCATPSRTTKKTDVLERFGLDRCTRTVCIRRDWIDVLERFVSIRLGCHHADRDNRTAG